VVDFVEISNVCARKGIIEAAKRIINSDEVRRSYEFWRHFFGTQCITVSVCYYMNSELSVNYYIIKSVMFIVIIIIIIAYLPAVFYSL